MRQQQFIKNAATMTVTSLLLRAIGIVFRIYLSAQIGAEGMGLYQLIFSVYVLASTFASCGISTAVARLITDELVCGDSKTVRKIMYRACGLSVCIGTVSALLLFGTAVPVGQLVLQDARAVLSLRILGISLPFMGISACVRGYFIARRKSLLPSVTQIVEQLTRIVCIMGALRILSTDNISHTCFAVILGDSLAEIVACLLLWGGYLFDRREIRHLQPTAKPLIKQKGGILYRILAISAPITTGRYLNSVLRTIENMLVPQKLAVFGGSSATALSQFGMLKGMAMPLLFFPASFLSSLSTLLIPEISEAHTLGQKKKVDTAVTLTLRLTLCISVLLSGLFTVFAYTLGDALYNSREVGFLLRVLAPLMPVMYLESIVDGMLKGLNQQVSSLWYSILDSLSRIFLILWLVPRKGMEGFLLIMVFSNLLTSLLNLNRLLHVTGIKMRWGQWLLKPVFAVVISALLYYGLQNVLHITTASAVIRLIIGSVTISAFYAILAFLCGIIKKEDLRNLKLRRSFAVMYMHEAKPSVKDICLSPYPAGCT